MEIYDNFLIVGDFNSETTESAMENLCGDLMENFLFMWLFIDQTFFVLRVIKNTFC